MAAPPAVCLAEPLPSSIYASSTPRPGPGFASIKKKMERPTSCDCAMPSGEKIPWLMALFRKRIFAGSTKIEVSGNRSCLTRKSTPAASAPESPFTAGPMTTNANSANNIPIMPAEKLFTSISKPLLILPSTAWSNFLIDQPPSGPTIIAPRNIGISVPTMTPIVVIAPTTAPRSPPASLPPV